METGKVENPSGHSTAIVGLGIWASICPGSLGNTESHLGWPPQQPGWGPYYGLPLVKG